VLWVGPGRSREAVRPFFEGLDEASRQRIKAVVMDMNTAFYLEIQAHYRLPLPISELEGINNRIKVIKRMAYGYSDEAYFFLKIRAAFPGNL